MHLFQGSLTAWLTEVREDENVWVMTDVVQIGRAQNLHQCHPLARNLDIEDIDLKPGCEGHDCQEI